MRQYWGGELTRFIREQQLLNQMLGKVVAVVARLEAPKPLKTK